MWKNVCSFAPENHAFLGLGMVHNTKYAWEHRQNDRKSLLAFQNSRAVHEVPLQGLVFRVWYAV